MRAVWTRRNLQLGTRAATCRACFAPLRKMSSCRHVRGQDGSADLGTLAVSDLEPRNWGRTMTQTQGYMIPIWRSNRIGPRTAEIYEGLLVASVLSFRASSGPGPDLLVVDIDCGLSGKTRNAIQPHARIWSGWELGKGLTWEQNCYNKLLCLAASPFDETALLDADLIWTGSAVNVWAGITAQIAGVHSPLYHRGKGCCACLTLCLDREAARAAISLRPDLHGGSEDSDEDAYDLAEERGLITRARLSPEWAFDGRALYWRGPGTQHDWDHPARWDRTSGTWTVDGRMVRSFHVSGIKERFLKDPRARDYLASCVGRIGIVRP